MEGKYIISIDLGTTNIKALLYDPFEGKPISIASKSVSKITPVRGWVEQNPEDLWNAMLSVLKEVLNRSGVEIHQVGALGLANQRGSIIVWSKRSGKPLYNIITWQCRRTNKIVQELAKKYKYIIKERTGLIPSSNFSLPKMKWIIENMPKIKEGLLKGEVAIGTIDTYFLWRLSGNRVYATDYTNASRTMLFNLWKLEWDSELLETLGGLNYC